MNAFKKVVVLNPSKRYQLSNDWNDYKHRDKIQDGATFHLKYLGSTLVEELEEEGASYGDQISSVAVNTVVHMANSSKKKLKKVSVTVSPRGIVVMDAEDHSTMTDLDIYRICFCTADKDHGRVFAFIARNKDNETMECHAFLCPKRKMAQAVTLTVAASFRMAKEICDAEEERLKQMRQPDGSRMVRLVENLSPDEGCEAFKSEIKSDFRSHAKVESVPRGSLRFDDDFEVSIGQDLKIVSNCRPIVSFTEQKNTTSISKICDNDLIQF